MAEKKHIILVVGMHRSGTSAITRGLEVLGVSLGDTLMPAADENAKGFWEDMDVVRINEALLERLGSSWHSVIPINEEMLLADEVKDLKMEAVALIKQRLSTFSVYGFKDPRTTILLPFWQKVFSELGVKHSYVIALRNPYNIVRSLEVRNQFSHSFSYMLWLKYQHAALRYTQDFPHVMVPFEHVMQEPEVALQHVAMQLDTPKQVKNNPAMAEYMHHFLEKGLEHHTNTVNRLESDPDVLPLVKASYVYQANMAVQKSSNKAEWKQLDKEWAAIQPLLPYYDEIQRTICEKYTSIQEEKAQMQKACEEKDKAIEALCNTVQAMEHSTSWRITAPLRVISRHFKRNT